jgi:hypothetical protein
MVVRHPHPNPLPPGRGGKLDTDFLIDGMNWDNMKK